MAEHVYLSTACLHGLHGYCQAPTVSRDGDWRVLGPSYTSALGVPKRPARCKFCSALCTCDCHDAERAQLAADLELLRNPPPGLMERIDAYVLGEPERPAECCCAGCIGMGPCDDDLGKSDAPECDHPWHDGEDDTSDMACPRCGELYAWSCCGSTDPEHLPSRCDAGPTDG